jgi:lipopolysaccharide/colanic/teichoic acid biosynthesis glycosyltransferase
MIRLFYAYIPLNTFLFAIFEIALMVGIFVGTTYLLVEVDPTDYLLNNLGWLSVLLVVLTFVLGLYFQDLYSEFHVKSRVLLLQQLLMVTGMALMVQGVVSYLDSDLRLPLRVMLAGCLAGLILIFASRVLFSLYAVHAAAKTPFLLVGSSPILAELGRYIEERPQTGLAVAGYVSETAGAEAAGAGKGFGDLRALREIAQTVRPARIILGLSAQPNRSLRNELLETRHAGYVMESAASAYERVCGRTSLHEILPPRPIGASIPEPSGRALFYHEFFDIALAVAASAIMLPAMLLTAVALAPAAGGRILERERMAGRGERPFVRYRFRTKGSNGIERIVRKLWLDGLPQWINVLKGEMAIVGPRAERPEYVDAIARHIPYYRERYRVKPGMTGWAQIHWSDRDAPEDTMAKLEYDLYYLKNISLSLNTLILLHTAKWMALSF